MFLLAIKNLTGSDISLSDGTVIRAGEEVFLDRDQAELADEARSKGCAVTLVHEGLSLS